MNVFCAIVLSVLTSGVAFAADPTARVDINATDSKLALKAGTVEGGVTSAPSPGQSGDAAKQNLMFNMPVTADKWTPMVIKFTAEGDGKVSLSLRGQYRKDAEVWVYYDAITVTGAEIKNGDFEDGTADKGIAKEWTAKGGQHPVVVKDDGVPQAGKACVKVSHGNRLAQEITVKAGQEVTITLEVKFDKVAEAGK